MRDGWTYKKLGEVCKLTMGQSPESESYNKEGNGMPFFQGCSDFGTLYPIVSTYCSSPKKTAEPLDVLISVRAPIGTLNLATSKCCIGRGLASIRAIENITVYKFLYYFLSNAKTNLQNQGTGATFKSIGKDILANYPVNLPPLTTQQQIVSELDLLTHILDQKRQQLKEYDALAESIFYDMFGDPVENPKGWEVKTIGDLCRDVKYGTSKPAVDGGQYPYLRMNNITSDGHLDLKDLKKIDIPDEEFEKCVVRYGDILFNRTNSLEHVGKTCMFDLAEPMIIAGYIIRVRLIDSAEPLFVAKFFNMPSTKKVLRKMAKGAVNQANINSKEMQTIPIPLPPLPLQQTFAAKIQSIEHQKQLLKESIKETEMLFQSRMDYWFNG